MGIGLRDIKKAAGNRKWLSRQGCPQWVSDIDTVARRRLRVHSAPAAAMAAPTPMAHWMLNWPATTPKTISEAQPDVDRGARCSGCRAAL